MSVPVTMPKLGLTMKTGKVSGWSKKEGDRDQKGEVLFEVETGKSTKKVEAPAVGNRGRCGPGCRNRALYLPKR